VECWASSCGTCGGGASREHYISDGIFDGESITAFGLSWCKVAPVSIGLASATAKILCKRHNEALSDFDAEASRLSRFIALNVVDEPTLAAETNLDGRLLEKWALKTLFNLGYVGALDPESSTRFTPPPDLVQKLFTGDAVDDGAGLYLVTGTVSNAGFKVGLAWHTIRNRANGKPVGMTFTFNGLRLAVSLPPMRAEEQIRGLGTANEFDFGDARVIYRPPNIIMGSEIAGHKVINLRW
jgi:hypothetical protein